MTQGTAGEVQQSTVDGTEITATGSCGKNFCHHPCRELTENLRRSPVATLLSVEEESEEVEADYALTCTKHRIPSVNPVHGNLMEP